MRYSLKDFNEILVGGQIRAMSDKTTNIINILTSKVGAPEYNKTPQFKNKILGQNHSNESIMNSGRRRKKIHEFNDAEWNTIRSFQTTELIKKEGVDANLNTIRKFLNMITFNTYDKLKIDIIEEINLVESTKIVNDLQYLCNEIFDIITCNILYSEIYSELYKDLLTKFNIFNEILMKNFEKFESKFYEIKYYDPEKDYDKFCENNKNKEKIRSVTTFYINLMKINILNSEKIANIILKTFTILQDYISSANKNILDELSELIYILVTNGYERIKNDHPNQATEILNNTKRISQMKVKNTPGITNKCIFKHMDILDKISNGS